MKGAVVSRVSWRNVPTLCKAGVVVLLVVFNTACVGSSVEQQTDQTVSLDEASNMKMTQVDVNHVLISFSPMLSTLYNRPGANYKSDGKTLWVSLPKCRVQTACPVMVTSTLNKAEHPAGRYEVVLPYRGERVLVSGSGPVEEELPLTR